MVSLAVCVKASNSAFVNDIITARILLASCLAKRPVKQSNYRAIADKQRTRKLPQGPDNSTI